ncbi:M15 family metallopeptidase [Mesobacillus maritimus]|uniref:M15 family metallopeptidase n=1 Tax=Mesobacillus maritimus TaxID=1643336 RepID=UPI00203F1717|nr:M15 family metallopeptidase [Mesobacillus maritimus]MCM3586213.1 M15 family metallopeptidase [Mesobacillus maritimus]MCM3667540.1 M15 family metallopeptidase [Mesobacillus maritimus]
MKLRGNLMITVLLAIVILILYIRTIGSSSVTQTQELPEDLHPELAYQADILIGKAAENGIQVVITDGFRSFQEQENLYAKGRTVAGNVVTNANAGESYHNFGLAIDFALKTPDGKIIWDMKYDGNKNNQADWMEVVAVAKELGFEWGGDWIGFKDYPHLQMDFGLSIRELQKGKRPDESLLTVESQ